MHADGARLADLRDPRKADLIAGIVELHVADHGDEAARLGLLHERPRLFRREGERLFDQHMLAGRQRRLDDLAMVIGADHDGIDRGIGEERAIIGIERLDAILRAELLEHAGRDVAERRDPERGQLVEIGQVHELRDLSAADDADADHLVVHVNPLPRRP